MTTYYQCPIFVEGKCPSRGLQTWLPGPPKVCLHAAPHVWGTACGTVCGVPAQYDTRGCTVVETYNKEAKRQLLKRLVLMCRVEGGE